KTDCCGASHTVARPDIVQTLVQRLYERALEAGAEAIVVSCQMCQANLDLPQAKISEIFGKSYDLPILYFTELIGAAWGAPESASWLARHLVDPRPLMEREGLI
ncbi:MAG: disulfide reductase, partial [Deltaproteobacteria bacterium]|nr:disulfide reductase [Deltaproteobacteria bacterium]